jgi:hypothetical protein
MLLQKYEKKLFCLLKIYNETSLRGQPSGRISRNRNHHSLLLIGLHLKCKYGRHTRYVELYEEEMGILFQKDIILTLRLNEDELGRYSSESRDINLIFLKV